MTEEAERLVALVKMYDRQIALSDAVVEAIPLCRHHARQSYTTGSHHPHTLHRMHNVRGSL